jgi:hypothetical protein
MSRLLHEPTIRLKGLDPERSHGSVKLVRELFGLGAGEAAEAEAAAEAGHGGDQAADVLPISRRQRA